MATDQNAQSRRTEHDKEQEQIMSHDKPRETLGEMLHRSRIYRERFWNLYKTLLRVERGDI
jgi:hypothetical protein